MHIDIISLFPETAIAPLSESIIRRAREKGLVEINAYQLRDWATDKHHTVDDTPYGGGHGMVMKIEPLVAAIEEIASPTTTKLLLAARGERFTQQKAAELAETDHILLICGRYEGVDERLDTYIDGQIAIGDYVLNGGEAGAAVVVDAVTRLVPGIIGNPESLETESFNQALLEHPQYTRPEVFRGQEVPSVLLSGNHAAIEKWRREIAEKDTRERRPDLWRRDRENKG